MHSVTEVARYFIQAYEKYTQSNFEPSELKLQKMMYFIQKHSYAFTGKPAFDAQFEGWTHGPVLKELRFFLESDYIEPVDESLISDELKYVVGNVLYEYAEYEAWKLRNLSHEEGAWLKSREGLAEGDRGSNVIQESDIIEDASKMRIYDHEFDMYLDEYSEWEECLSEC